MQCVFVQLEEKKRIERQTVKADKLKMQRKYEEVVRWWSGVQVYMPNKDIGDENEHTSVATDRLIQQYTSDYSRWNDWTPSDEVSLQEERELLRVSEEAKNKEFEALNPDFCGQFLDDMHTRQRAVEKKSDSANIYRLRGNTLYKARQFERALEQYMEALKLTPFDTKTLTNIAQVRWLVNCLYQHHQWPAIW